MPRAIFDLLKRKILRDCLAVSKIIFIFAPRKEKDMEERTVTYWIDIANYDMDTAEAIKNCSNG